MRKTTNKTIWLSSPHMASNELTYINQAFKDNQIAPAGTFIADFENSLSDYLGNQAQVAVLNSGTAALHLALILLGIGPDDEVICQSFTFTASANPVVYQGALPVFVDSEPNTWNICPDVLKKAIESRISKGKKPKAIIAVHSYGMPYCSEEIMQIARYYEIPVIEDAAEALGSSYQGEKCGTLGDISVLSFNGNKIITTSAGGALVCKSEALKEQAVYLATQAREKVPHYQHNQIGYNYRMSNICAAIGTGQLEVLDKHLALRKRNHQFYQSFFESLPFVSVQEVPSEQFKSNYWLSTILISPKSKVKPEEVCLALEADKIESRPLWKPLHLQPVFASAPYYGADVAENLFRRGLCLPSGSNISEEDLIAIEKSLIKVLT